jgi:phenylalanyl-tRNA synthetase beta chain
VAFAQVADAIRALAIPELRSVEAADVFRGGKMAAGKFSLMIRVTFQSGETTFTDAQIAEFSARIVAALETKLGATLRIS